ncbi:GtrA family protein [Methylomonas sp. LW13]|nr:MULTISPECIES: GtrA family protein [unclassified Methylomonas]NOV30121.1 GtrA family protein [Methylomonas sp. ZR1]PKD38297.1 GtrA family protein [Methylomonas sp. Kb3]QBC29956.1 GtrA family protein [Methylomonas sp. LW13]
MSLPQKRSRSSVKQLFRYGVVGVFSNSVGYMVYLLVTYFGGAPKITMTCLYAVGAVIGFIGNRKLTFAHSGSLLGAGVRYAIVHCVGYFINLGILIVMVDKLGYPHELVQAAAIFIVALFLFFTFKFFVFTASGSVNAGKV